jgi:hypothetical protein
MPETRFTRAHLGKFPADAVIELPLLAGRCCDEDVFPFEQAQWANAISMMQMAHYECETCGRVWGRSFPLYRRVASARA